MIDPEQHQTATVAKVTLREIITDGIRFWEPLRLLYNGALTAMVAAYFCAGLPQSRSFLSVDGCFGLIVLAVLANLCYCAAYIVDIFAQLSGFRETWRKWRGLLFAVGLLFAGIIARFIVMSVFLPNQLG